MKIKKSWFWRKINYRDGRFQYWSAEIKGERDPKMAEGSSLKDWKKVVLLRPLGSSATTFSMGFSDLSGQSKVSSSTRRVGDGLFGMRMGPKDCLFFIVSNNGTVGLEVAGYTTINDATKSELVLY